MVLRQRKQRWRPAARIKNPRGGCRRAQERSSHFANYSIPVWMSSEKFFPRLGAVGAGESARDGSPAGCRSRVDVTANGVGRLRIFKS